MLEKNKPVVSEFCNKLRPCGRILEQEDYFVWGCSPIYDEYGAVHVFYSRWPVTLGMEGWLTHSEIVHGRSMSPFGPYEINEIISPRKDSWDCCMLHNPTIHCVDGRYYLFYMANSDGTLRTKAIGVAVSDSLTGSWHRFDRPIVSKGNSGDWDDFCCSNPAFLMDFSGKSRLYYKGWNVSDYNRDLENNVPHPEYGIPILGNRKYGFAVSDNPAGKYDKYQGNPVLDFSHFGNNTQLEDAYLWTENGKYHIVCRDMGYYNHQYGIYMCSDDGINWSKPEIAFYGAANYSNESNDLANRGGRFERPQLLFKDGKPEFMFVAYPGGKFGTSSPFIFRISE